MHVVANMDRPQGTEELVICPICSKEQPLERINSHIDNCLQESSHNGDSKPRPSDKKKRSGSNRHDEDRERKKAKVELKETCNTKVPANHDQIPSGTSTSCNVRPGPSTDPSEKMHKGVTRCEDQISSPESGKGIKEEDAQRERKHSRQTGDSPPTQKTQKVLRQSSLVQQRSPPQSVDHQHGSKQGDVSSKLDQSHSQVSHEGTCSEEGIFGKFTSSSGNHPRPTTSKKQPLQAKTDFRPLAERMRPGTIEEFVGQGNIFGTNTILKKLINNGQIPSLILWGPPGCGKTTLASIIANKMKELSNTKLVKLSATTSNVSEVKKVTAEAVNLQRMFKRKTLLFMDEIHRFNKLQQDTFLPFVENGTIILLGATTENPSFQLNSALLSRCQVIVLTKHSSDDLMSILKRATASLGVAIVKDSESDFEKSGENIKIQEEALVMLANFCDGDARSALNVLEMTVRSCQGTPDSQGKGKHGALLVDNGKKSNIITVDLVKESLQRSHILYDRTGNSK